MAGEITVNVSLQVIKNNLFYTSNPTQFRADLETEKGPTPGSITVNSDGISIEFEELETPGICRLLNVSQTNRVEYGILDPETEVFYPFGELLPGEIAIFRFSRFLRSQFGTGSGTGTTGPDTNTFYLRSYNGDATVIIDCFEG